MENLLPLGKESAIRAVPQHSTLKVNGEHHIFRSKEALTSVKPIHPDAAFSVHWIQDQRRIKDALCIAGHCSFPSKQKTKEDNCCLLEYTCCIYFLWTTSKWGAIWLLFFFTLPTSPFQKVVHNAFLPESMSIYVSYRHRVSVLCSLLLIRAHKTRHLFPTPFGLYIICFVSFHLLTVKWALELLRKKTCYTGTTGVAQQAPSDTGTFSVRLLAPRMNLAATPVWVPALAANLQLPCGQSHCCP